MATLTLTRQQLYDRAWTTTIENLARELGLSGRGLGKLCARHDIPVPPRGYWAKKAVGKRVSKPSLPLPETYGQKIRFNSPASGAPTESTDDAVHPLVAFEALAENTIAVSESSPLTKALVLKTQRLLARGKRDANALIVPPSGALQIHTSRALHDRSLRIMQTLLEAFAKRGFPVEPSTGGMRVKILDELLGFGIEEATKTVEHRRTFTEQKLIDRGFGHQVPSVDRVPSGRLTLVITNVGHVRQRWAEGSKSAELMLNTFVVGLIRAALGLKRQRADAERKEVERLERERKRKEEEKRRAEIAMRWHHEQTRVEQLERLVAVWRRNQELRELLKSLRAAIGEVEQDSSLARWLLWATEHVEGSDPLNRLRRRTGGTLTLYYHGYDSAMVPETGFREPDNHPAYGATERKKRGVELTCRPPQSDSYERALKLEVPEDLVLPFEWAQESDWLWRVFRVPAAILNDTLGYGGQAASEKNDTAWIT